ncbi:hypothetical protein ACS2QC_28405 [Bacillus cereus group sp. Bce033]|uniref:hypothetical protein n=1 Tax=Bacillus TaxID=1386 RepID=UPI000F514DC3|nr:hypothetical protein [Bacillus sp. FDAARGOS_527]AYY25026.1 hypothetical protein EGX95_00025 [Bacillus sp. FDAARGOS_527]
MTKEQHTYHVTFYLSDGKEVNGRITHHEDVGTYLKALEVAIENKKTITMKNIGVVIQSKYITHVKVMEVKTEKSDT